MRPRVLMVGRTRYTLPLNESLRRKFDALRAVLDVRVLGSAPERAPTEDDTFRLFGPVRPPALDGLAYYASLPLRIARELVRFRPDTVLVQGPHEAAAVLVARSLVGSRARVVVDVHGDWRTATRLYGSTARRLLSPLADRLALAALHRVDGIRAVSEYTGGLVRAVGLEPAAVFPAFMDLDPFLATPPAPLPEPPALLFVGVLELYKNVDGLAEAWRVAAPRLPRTELRIVGDGSRAEILEKLVRELPDRTSWRRSLSTQEIARELDRATALVLPSRSEGMGRVIVEALCRGRPVVATRVGGVGDLVEDGVNGLLVEPGEMHALADALVRIVEDRELAAVLAARARPSAERLLASPDQYATSVRELVEAVAARSGAGE